MNKVQAMTDSVKEVAAYAFGVTLVGMGLFWLFEGGNAFDALYWAVVSGSSTGYGDLTPKTVGGRLTAIVYIVIMIWVITPVLTARIASEMIVNSDAFTHDEQEQFKSDLAEIKQLLTKDPA